VGKYVASSIEGAKLVQYKYGPHLLVENEYDQMLLQHIGLMSDQQFAAFNRILLELPGMSLHSSKTILSALQEGRIPAYTVTMLGIMFNQRQQKQRVY
jgi:hypothetical protein